MPPLLTLIALVIWASLLFGGFLFGKLWADRSRRMPVWTRMASSLTLVIAAWLFVLIDPAVHVYTLPVAVGMTFGFLGDLFMAKLIPFKQYVIGGIGSFGIGHILYIVGFLATMNALGLPVVGAAWLVWLLIGVVGWLVAVWIGAADRGLMHRLALPYALLLASTVGVATGWALGDSRFIPLAVGAALFLLSDLILAARLFRGTTFYLIDDVVWLTYGPAQMLIVFSALLVQPLL
ncbi:MAG: lysoplasmalogenase [Anaerolinea sp.]|nr:lysoplasmalogenase [Anaerolinea sp.]